MTLSAHRRRDRKRTRWIRVWLNGVEVTDRCYYADGRRGVVRLYKRNEHGQIYREPIQGTAQWRVATEERRGHVRWGRKVAA